MAKAHPGDSTAQTPRPALHFDHYTAADGLPTDALYDVHLAPDGELYVGSERGLLRYRSGVWQSVPTAAGERPSISTLHSTATGRTFGMTFDSRVYEVAGDTLALHVDLRDEIDYISSWELVADSLIVVGARGALLVKHVDRPGRRWLTAPAHFRFGSLIPLAAVGDTLYFDGRNALGAVALSTGGFALRRRFAGPTQLSAARVDGGLRVIEGYFNTPSAAYEVGPLRPDTAFNHWLGPRRVIRVQQYGRELYVATTTGLVVGRPGGARREYLPGESVSASALDEEGMLWVTSPTGGLFVAPNTDLVYHATHGRAGVEQVCAYGGHAVGIDREARFYDLDAGARLDDGPALRPGQLPTREIVGTPYGVFAVRGGDLLRVGADGRRSVRAGGAKAVEVLPDGTLYLGSVYHLLARPVHDQRASACYPEARTTEDYSVRAGRTLAVRQRDCEAPILIATRDDLYRAGSSARALVGEWVRVRGEGERRVKARELIDLGEAWAAVTDADLYVVSKTGDAVACRVTPPRLEGEVLVRARLADGRLFVAAQSGLYGVDVDAWRVDFHADAASGLPSDVVHDVDHVGDRYYVTTDGGLLVAASLRPRATSRPRIRASRIVTPDSTYGPTQSIDLGYGVPVEALVVDALGHQMGRDFVVEYRLDDAREAGGPTADGGAAPLTWRSLAPGETAISPGALPDGSHRLRVRVRGPHGRYSETLLYRLRVATPYYLQPAFLALVALLSVGLLTAVFLSRERLLRRRLELEKKVVTSEITALKSQMNPHFIFNALNSIQDLILGNEVDASRAYLGKFSRLMRDVLEKSSAELIRVAQEAEMLRVYLELEQLRFTERFAFDIEAEPACAHALLPPLMVQPYVENALKHGLIHRAGPQRLTVRFEARAGGGTRCTIDDNGVGRAASAAIKARRARLHRHRSFAMASNERRIDLLNRLLDLRIGVEVVDKPDGAGTTVVIDVPPLERAAATVREVGVGPREV